MSEIVAAPSMTRIREELLPSEPVKESLSTFLERPSDSDIRFYTQAERRVPTQEYWGDEYQQFVRRAQTRLKRFGRSTLALAANVRAAANESGLTLLFDVVESDKPLLDGMTNALNEIEWGESPTGLYVQMARSSLAKSAQQRRSAARLLTARLRDPTANLQMRVGSARLVSRDTSIPISFDR